MIFGFNTDVKFADTVYHVQSEARQHELVLQTLVFLKGRCIGKRTQSYAEQTQEPGFSEEHMHEMLKDQHKHFVAAVREGRIDSELADHAEHAHAEAPVPAAAEHAEQEHVESPLPAAAEHAEHEHAEAPQPAAAAYIAEFAAPAEAAAVADSEPEEPAVIEPEITPEVVAPAPAEDLAAPAEAATVAASEPEEPTVIEPEMTPEVVAPAPAKDLAAPAEEVAVAASEPEEPTTVVMEAPAMAPADDLVAPVEAAAVAASEPEEHTTVVMEPPAQAPADDLAVQFAAAVASKPVDPGLILTAAGKLIGKGLSVECRPPVAGAGDGVVSIGVEIGDENGPAAGAQVSCRITSGKSHASYVYATTGAEGVADVQLALKDLDLSATALLIQASHRGKTASRKYKLQTAS